MDGMIRIGLAIHRSYAYFRDVLRGIRRYAELKPQWCISAVIPEQQPSHILRRRLVGMIASVDTPDMAQALRSLRRPAVNVSDTLPGLKYPRVGPDNASVGRLAADHFLERGVRNFAYFGPRDHLYSVERFAAYSQALKDAGCDVSWCNLPARLAFDPQNRRWDVEPTVHRWLNKLPKPVGVFTPGDNWGVQLAEACWRVRLRVPEDVALLGVDNDELDCEFTRPQLSSVILPAERIGYEAAALLDRLLAGEHPPAAPILLSSPGVAARRSTEILAIDDEDVVAAVRFIREHAHMPLAVTDVLQEVSIGRRSLELRFRKSLGRGVGEEIRRAHLEQAKRLLARTGLPLKAVAQQAGFSDFRHMAVAFRRELRVTPNTYRHQMRDETGGAVG